MLAIINTEGQQIYGTKQQPMTIQALKDELKSTRFLSSKFVFRNIRDVHVNTE